MICLPPDIVELFDKCQEKLGLIPNVLRAYSFAPEKLRAFNGLYNDLMLADSGLSKLEREMIAVVVSSINHCFYCLTAHGAAVRVLSGDPALGELLAFNYRAAQLSSRHRAMLDFAALMTTGSAQISESDREALRAEGFSDPDIWDIARRCQLFQHDQPPGLGRRHAAQLRISSQGAMIGSEIPVRSRALYETRNPGNPETKGWMI